MEKNTSTIQSMTLSAKDEASLAPMTNLEEKELLRVFNLLTCFHQKHKIHQEISELEDWKTSTRNQSLHPESSAVNLLTGNFNTAEELAQKNEKRLEALKQELHHLESKPDQSISVLDVIDVHKFLKKKITKYEAEEMIWEVDEDLDNCLTWPEFKLMFNRNITDRTGLEPSRLFNLAQFLMYDHNNTGKVSVDGTMHMLYARYGRLKMESKLKELFGEDMHETGREGGEITFAKYLNAVEKIQIQTFYNTTKGRTALAKDTYKMSLDIHTDDIDTN